MRIPRLLTTALLLLAGTSSLHAQSRTCLHDQSETAADLSRREKAVDPAYEINRLQARPLTPRQAPVPLDQLRLPPTPPGFQVQFHLDGTKYSFSIKDTRDPCGYAIFSDQDGQVYEATPSRLRGGVRLLPAR